MGQTGAPEQDMSADMRGLEISFINKTGNIGKILKQDYTWFLK